MQLGMIGLGRMGSNMVRRLIGGETPCVKHLDPVLVRLAPGVGTIYCTQGRDEVGGTCEHNLRARLSQSPPLVGSHQIELAMVPDAPPAGLRMADGVFEIPAAEGSGIEHLMKAAGRFPIREIGDNVRAITEHLKTLIASPQIEDSIIHIDDALVRLDQTLREAGPKVAPTIQSVHDTVDSLRHTANDLDGTVQAARAVIGADPAAPDGSLEPTLLHVSEAARAIRGLADFLDEHPESLIKGRTK